MITQTSSSPLEQVARPKRSGVDAEALLRSLAPVVAKPESAPAPAPSPTPVMAEAPKPEPKPEPQPEPRAEKPQPRKPKKARKPEPVDDYDDEDDFEEPIPAKQQGGKRAQMDVAINPGEGSTAIYVRVPRTTHVALKLMALQNQAAMEGPTELASIVRTAIDEYMARQARAAKRAA